MGRYDKIYEAKHGQYLNICDKNNRTLEASGCFYILSIHIYPLVISRK